LKVRIETLAATTWVNPEGRLDFAAAPAFQRQLEEMLASARPASAKRAASAASAAPAAPAAVIIDGSALDYVSSAGLRVFLVAARAAQRAGVRFALCALTPAVREVFELSGFARLVAVHADRVAASADAPQQPPAERRITVPGQAEQLSRLTEFLHEFWTAIELPRAQGLAFELALEEVFMNVVLHASADGRTLRVEVSVSLADGTLTMTVADDGPQFDPLSLPPPDVTSGLAERRIGGYGVFLVRQMMDSVSYQRTGAQNQLKMSKPITR
jgi:serine/threonine-protein kinase RsbW